jgi:hypothetical protein
VDVSRKLRYRYKETRERWPLLTVETEVNRDSKRTNERGPSLVGSWGLSRRYKRFLFCLGCSNRPSTKYFFPPCTLFQFLCPHRPTSWPGSHAVSPASCCRSSFRGQIQEDKYSTRQKYEEKEEKKHIAILVKDRKICRCESFIRSKPLKIRAKNPDPR